MKKLLLTLVFTSVASICWSQTTEVYGHPLDDPGCALHWVVYLPAGGGTHPACILVHGGKFQSETPTSNGEQVAAAHDMANAGYLALSIEYREAGAHPLAGQTTPGTYDEQAVDVKMAVDTARVDSRCNGQVVMLGGSSGGTHSLMMIDSYNAGTQPLGAVVLSPATEFSDRTAPGYEGLGDFINAVTTYCGTSNLVTQLADSPVTFVTSASKPIFVVFSINDPQPYPQMADLTNALTTAGVTNFIQATLAGNGHSWDNWAPVKATAISFLNAALAGGTPPPVFITSKIYYNRP